MPYLFPVIARFPGSILNALWRLGGSIEFFVFFPDLVAVK
jgi:hypothetical protein